MEILTNKKYDHRFIACIISERFVTWNLYFRLRDTDDFLILTDKRHLNVRGGDESLFKPWGDSDLRNISPLSVFDELEGLITAVWLEAQDGEELSFCSYQEFINWLSGCLIYSPESSHRQGEGYIQQYS